MSIKPTNTERDHFIHLSPTILSASPSPRLPPEPEILIKVRALTTSSTRVEWSQNWRGKWSGGVDGRCCGSTSTFTHLLSSFLLVSNLSTSDSTDRVVSQLTFSLLKSSSGGKRSTCIYPQTQSGIVICVMLFRPSHISGK